MSTCPICCDEIVDSTENSEGQEALFCEGTCQKWLHRWCAGVHKDSYASLTLNSKPFLCPSCCLTEHTKLITTLIETVESLKCEIQQLKEEKDASKPRSSSDTSKVESESALPTASTVHQEKDTNVEQEHGWKTVTAKRRGKQGQNGVNGGKGKDVRAGTPPTKQAEKKPPDQARRRPQWLHVTSVQQPSVQNKPHSASLLRKTEPSPENSCVTEEVDGMRRIWGTMRSCTSRTVLTALQKMSSVTDKVEVRRKFKKNRNNTVQWWFLIRGEEEVLQVLQQEWEGIYSQTSWKLERCCRPVQNNGEQSPGDLCSFLEKN